MGLSFGPNSRFVIRDAFEIQQHHSTVYLPGVVIILDRCIPASLESLTGLRAVIHLTAQDVVVLKIDAAKDHGVATSLYFQGKSLQDVQIGAEVAIVYE